MVVKFPKWPFDKFVYAKRTLGTQMKATGEVMAIGATFEQAIMKAVRGAEISHDSLNDKKCEAQDDETIRARLRDCTDERLFVVYEALKRGVSVDEVFEATKIDRWFLHKFLNLIRMDRALAEGYDDDLYMQAKRMGYPDRLIESLSGKRVEKSARWPVYNMVEPAAAEFSAKRPFSTPS